MKERPILFNGAMVRAILDGTKTQTRRPIVPQPTEDADEVFIWPSVPPMPHHRNPGVWARKHSSEEDAGDGWLRFLARNPFGWRGDRLWVRECWSPDHKAFYPNVTVVYRAAGYPSIHDIENGTIYSPEAKETFPFKWRPSIHMKRWASRITLEVKRVWVERVQEISEEDARAEGFERREHFIRAWDSIYAAKGYPFDDNPWVCGCEFERRLR